MPKTGAASATLTFLLTAFGFVPIDSKHTIAVLYASLPWASVLLLGYVFGSLYRPAADPRRRKRVLLAAGLALTALFIILRWLNGYGNPVPWSVQRNAAHTILSFLNTTKQPPALTYLSMTLGPALLLLGLLEDAGGVKRRLAAICRVYGSVPYFYFILHLCLIRVINMVLILVLGVDRRSNGSPLVWQAAEFGIPLWAVYLIWVLVVISLYWPCQWFGEYKRGSRRWWISYL